MSDREAEEIVDSICRQKRECPETMPDCPKCGNNRQVWKNQITGKLTCHRAFCHTVINDNPNTGSHRPSEPEANEGSVG